MVVLFDADSLIFSSCYKKKESIEDDGFHHVLEDAIVKFDEVFMSIINHLEDIYKFQNVGFLNLEFALC